MAVYVSELENWQCEVPEAFKRRQDWIVLGLSEVDRGFMLSFLGARRMILAMSCFFSSCKLCVTSHNTFFKMLRHQFFKPH